MAIEVTMPQLGESVVEGTVSRWLAGTWAEPSTTDPTTDRAPRARLRRARSLEGDLPAGSLRTTPV